MVSQNDNWFDFLIIGSGTAGAVLAARLSEDPAAKVGLVEAGTAATDPRVADPRAWPLLQGSAIDWGYRTLPQRHAAGRVFDWPRGKAIGGSTTINAMAHVRGHPDDFAAWVAAGCAGWGYADLMPYFLKSETYVPGSSKWHGGGGPLHLIRPSEPHPITTAYMAAGVEAGFAPTDDHNGARMAGPCVNTLTIKDGRRQTIADAYLAPAAGRPNLALLAGGEVLSLILENGRCRGVRVRTGAGVGSIGAGTVILAAGAIGSPCLLMRSGIGPADELRRLGIAVAADRPEVGRNLHDHLLSGGNVYRARRPVPLSKYQNSESLMYVGRAGAGGAPELVLACVVAPVATEQFEAPPFGEAYTLMFGFTRPRSRGTVRLASADPRVMPLIDPNYLAEAYDRDAYLDALDTARMVGAGTALDEWRAGEVLPGPSVRDQASKRAFLEKAAFTHHHPVATCRMGGDAASVVDAGLKVRGVDGLCVCDASVIPVITTGPVNAAIVAIAERLGDLLRGRTPLAPFDPREAA
ncbi:MAG TPA: GMC family oxidoreductase N-terminal domain-containing protein [Dongiaceae bacterium]|nr:GMC family oxidoreductase N-terminal domain-containing protein [Dongiaceae bacterium]